VPEIVQGRADADVLKLVSVDQLKEHKRITGGRENDLIKDCILDAWDWLDGPEGKCRRAVLPQKWALTLATWPEGSWRIPLAGACAVTRITTIAAPGASPVELSPAAYTSHTAGRWDCFLTMTPGVSLPSLAAVPNAVRVEFDAGWPTAEALPRVFRRALLLLAAHYFDNREAARFDTRVSEVSRKIEFGVDALLEKQIVPLDYAGGQR
jgi:uncharacterized phiE125 gp8 family phage protein